MSEEKIGRSGQPTHRPGGRGGRIIRVTTLAAEGPGSLREAIEAKGPRIVVFEVGGVIDFGMKELRVNEPFLTIAGQTAPHPGVTIVKGGLTIATNDVVIRHIRVRPGDGHRPKRSGDIDAITGEIQSGDGTAHELIYGQEGARLITNLADTAGETATILRDVRTGDGNAHDLLYGDSAGDLIENLTAITADVRVIAAETRAGRGTLGGLLMDPSIYEDIKRLVGNLERNDILRSLVRYSIREDEAQDPAPRPQPVAPRPATD